MLEVRKGGVLDQLAKAAAATPRPAILGSTDER